ncbi:ubiquitin carboxyl-terminal hydrolase CYLD-like [Spea bombifrons]|uniref:ubiquitin carboxyl-terminal hydrolase CYLD-like n=1 Tax=Spea bombifrons TaxID=233779 RepID=UPI00234BEA5B|nr:ubiquitin carboxyl-terminal hydrolase CYLD-like [Spea bombifrons]
MAGETGDPLMYFILTDAFSAGSRVTEAGRLCCVTEEDYLQQVAEDQHRPRGCLSVTVIGDDAAGEVDVNALQPLHRKMASLLLAVADPTERLGCFLERGLLEQAARAEVGQWVLVEHERQLFPALLRHVGSVLDSSSLLPPVYFGVELEGDGEGRGENDGTYKGVTFFKCKKNSGLFLPFNKVLFSGSLHVDDGERQPSHADQQSSVNPGEKVVYYVEDSLKRGTIIVTSDEASNGFVEVLPEEGSPEGLLKLPLDSLLKEEAVSGGNDIVDWNISPVAGGSGHNGSDLAQRPLELSSVVQIEYKAGEMIYGIIRWMGYLPNVEEEMVGVELEEDKGHTDGCWQNRQYFVCPPKRGIFVKLRACWPDKRFLNSRDPPAKSPEHAPRGDSCLSGTDDKVMEGVPPLQGTVAVDVLLGRMKGIQGHCNSCYMDAALFSLFSCSSVLDSLLFKPSSVPDGHIQRILREKIVNPLRRTGFVSAESVMVLRQQLKQESRCPSFTTSEKDPEEFLNVIMSRILGLEPLLKLQSEGQKVQDCYCYQIFLEQQPEMTVPSVQQLLEHSFHHSNLKLAEVPSCFIIQTPRFGKDYKMFSKIIPSLELDVTDLLQDSPRECVVCGRLATRECAECFTDVILSDSGLKQYCDVCAKQVHSHQKRRSHRLTQLGVPDGFGEMRSEGPGHVPRETLELFGVLCIETSHYVSFVKYGPEKGSWMFFDSMADRYGGEEGYNIPEVSLCPEVATYLAAPLRDLSNQNPRDMRGVAKRLFCDAYMYMYQSRRMAMYK